MTDRYPVHDIEAKWRRRWEETAIYRVDLDHAGRPFYNLMEFPYPSGEGLHVGHVYTYCGADAFGRLRRMQGYDVFQPMGFDAFGIHSENYALKVGVHPAQLVPVNIDRFREEQLKRLGCQFDWSREVDTTDPGYYKWTQWIFIQLFKAGLAYRAEAPVNWCPQDQTVLANEQVIDGRCERCDSPIEQKVMRQWFFRITAYADRLLDFNGVDFPEASIKRQTAWIGRSEGAEIEFPVDGYAASIVVFTTRPDTIYGATFVVLAPEHPLVAAITAVEQRRAVESYVEQSQRKLERERLIGAEKTGVFTGAYAINPVNNQRIPIWIADYVLARYGTGAIMAVPAHDERDFEFARRYDLPIRRVIAPRLEEADAPLKEAYVEPGVLVDSGPFSGMPHQEAARAITAWLEERGAGKAAATYRLRDWLISRQRYWGPPIPIVYCDRCGTQPVPEDQLPVLLPPLEQFRPMGTSPLAAVPEFVNTTCPQCAGPARRETDVSDNFLDSAWYFLRYTSTEYDDRPWDQERVRRWLPIDQYAGGPEHTTMHHLYARFIYKALYDLGHVPTDEPFKRLRLHGMITKDGAKMSKSRGNVVTPDAYTAQYGADIFRMYMLFLGPWQEGGDFTDAGISGVARFAVRLWDFITSGPPSGHPEPDVSEEAERRRQRLIARVTESIEELRFHVAIAALMEELNWLRDNAAGQTEQQWRRSAQTLVLLLAPLAPHLAEELWERLGGAYSVHQQPWPIWDPAMLEETTIEIPIQVNGRVRDRITIPATADRDAVINAALASERVRSALEGATPTRVVVVPGKIINIVA
ncbi:MAG: leucine--tRNA ligase [Herpetosiphonaceae bacterium]|nr:MAG: leucine--tRNA ligase [Herpetosiphonaceae bacterium]